MSGFEVAGIVLGALPLILEALKAGNEVKSKVDKILSKERYIAGYINRINWHQVSLADSIQKVAKFACIPNITDETIESKEAFEILNKHYDTLADAIGPKRCRTLIESIQQAEVLYEDLVRQFDGLFPHKVSLLRDDPHLLRHLVNMTKDDTAKLWKQKRQKIKFLSRQKQIEEHLKALDDIIETVEKLASLSTATRTPTVTLQQPAKRKDHSARLERLHKAAAQLFSAVAKVVPGRCTAHETHAVRVFLESHTDRPRFEGDEDKDPTFNLEILGFSANQLMGVHHKGRIVVRQHRDDPASNMSKPTRQVQFASAVTHTRPSTMAPAPQIHQITTICSSLQISADHMNIHMTSAGVLRCQQVTKAIQTTPVQTLVTLSDVFIRSSVPNSREANWTFLGRTTFGFVLASSILQLSCANCIPQRFDASSINFYTKHDAEKDEPPFDPDQPFVENRDPPRILQPPQQSAKHLTLNLGILLLELWTGVSFASWLIKQGIKETDDHTLRGVAAQRWLQELYPHLLPCYKDAIVRCMELSGMEFYSWDHKQFRERFCEDVIQPLHDFSRSLRVAD